jgi:hypothetical protein
MQITELREQAVNRSRIPMNDADRFKLLHGPYRAPKYRIGRLFAVPDDLSKSDQAASSRPRGARRLNR